MTEHKAEISARLKRAREATQPRLTQEDVAARLGVSSWTVSKWENDTMPPADRLRELARLYAVSADGLLGLSDESGPRPVVADAERVAIDMSWFAELLNQPSAAAMRDLLERNGDSLRARNVVLVDVAEEQRLEELVDQRLAQREAAPRRA